MNKELIPSFEDFINESKLTPETAYKSNKKSMQQKIVKPGYYDVVESDYDGFRDITQVSIQVTEKMTQWDLAIQLFKKLNYLSEWPYISLREIKKKNDLPVFPDNQMELNL